MIITERSLYKKIIEYFGEPKGICIIAIPRKIFFQVHNFLENWSEYTRQRVQPQIEKNCQIGSLARINKTIVIIGDIVTIEEFAVVRENVYIGDNTIIRAGAKIGSQGFEYKRTDNGIMSVCHFGGVKIGANVEIQCNTCVDCTIYPWEDTLIGDFSKIDNLVHIRHAAKIGKRILIVVQSGIGGRTLIFNNSWVGSGATISNGLMKVCPGGIKDKMIAFHQV